MTKKKEMQSLYKSELGKDKGYKRTRSPEADRYWDGCKEGRLMLPFCTDCSEYHFYPRPFCPLCGSEQLEWRESSSTGTVYSFAVVHQPIEKPFADLVPYVIAIVELEEGVRLLSRVETDEPDSMDCGTKVKADFVASSPDLTIPVFRQVQ